MGLMVGRGEEKRRKIVEKKYRHPTKDETQSSKTQLEWFEGDFCFLVKSQCQGFSLGV